MAAQNADVAQRGILTLFYVSLRVIVWAPGMGPQTPTGLCTPAVSGCGGVGEQGLRLQYRGYEQHRRLFQRTAHLLKWWGSLYREMGARGWGLGERKCCHRAWALQAVRQISKLLVT